MRSQRIVGVVLWCLFLMCALPVAQNEYRLPPEDVVRILDAAPTPVSSVSPAGDRLLLAQYRSMPSIEHMAKPILRLAGVRIEPNSNARQVTTFYVELTILNLKDRSSQRLKLPEAANVTSFRWSFDGTRIALTRQADHGIELWVADPDTGQVRVVTTGRLNATLGAGYQWMPDNRSLFCLLVPENRGPVPSPPVVPAGPDAQETSGRFSPVRTYQDLLTSKYDEDLFEYYMTAQPALVDLEGRRTIRVGKPGIYASASPSPGGEYLLIERLRRPYSRSVPYRLFSRAVEVWDGTGRLMHTVADLPVSDEVPIQGVATGPRSVRWRPLRESSLYWVEALDDGDPRKDVPHRDRIMAAVAPFQTAPVEVMRIEERYSGVSWLESDGRALVSEYDRDRRWRTTRLVDFDQPVETRVVFDRSVQDRYNDPGSPVTSTTARGEELLLQDGEWIYLAGRGATAEGDRPLLQRFHLGTLEKEILFRSGQSVYESFVDFVDGPQNRIITRYESKSEPPNYYLRDLSADSREALTSFSDPAPELTGIRKQLVKYTREDGVPLSGTLYLPPGHTEGRRLPLVVWAYPLEYNDARTAGQVRGSPNRFIRMRGASHLFFLTQGYAVLDGAQMPVVGDPETVNDTFVRQIVMSAKAAIEKMDEMGVADPDRVGVGGHSYGAFMTANLLAHSDLFRAGIARSGAYNRTLTPFGFQSERRTLWQAPDLYFKVSPFMHADKINEPMLMIHGEMDNNSGTFPIQSQRLFHALKGHGATARLVMLPHESHGYRARESVLHALAEMFDWFDLYVKNGGGEAGDPSDQTKAYSSETQP